MLRRAFTLVELLVTIGIIGILASTVVVNVSRSRGKARDARRKADLKALQTALEAFNDDNGSYPSTNNQFLLETTTAWVPGLTPNYLAVLPSDPTRGKATTTAGGCNDSIAGYAYYGTGSDYKLVARCTVETPISSNDPFRDPAGRPNTYALYSGGGVNF